MSPSDIPDNVAGLDRMLANQRRRHLVVQLMTARRWVMQLEDLLIDGVSPTGYGASLTPLSAEEAQRVLDPVKHLLERWRQLALEHAAEQLEAVDHRRQIGETKRWARLLLRKLEDLVDETVADASTADGTSRLHEEAAEFGQEARDLIRNARQALEGREARSGARRESGDD